MGRGFVRDVLKTRQTEGSFTTFPDFCQRMMDADLNRRVVENLIRCGAFDSMGYKRSQLIQVYGQVIDGIAASRKKNLEGQFDLFGSGESGGSSAQELILPNHSGISAAGIDGDGKGNHRALSQWAPHGCLSRAGPGVTMR